MVKLNKLLEAAFSTHYITKYPIKRINDHFILQVVVFIGRTAYENMFGLALLRLDSSSYCNALVSCWLISPLC